MVKLKIVALLGAMLVIRITVAQHTDSSWVKMMANPSSNFYNIQNSFEEYWLDRPIDKGKGYKVFKRWEDFMAPRVYPSGDITLPSRNYANYLEWTATQPNGILKSTNGTWSLLGPNGRPNFGFNGRVNFVCVHPTNANTLYVGAPDGGLWKSDNGGTSWTTNTDQLTVIGCSDMIIDPTNTQIMYLATGDGDAADSYSVGVLKSTDGGLTWNPSGLSWTVDQGRLISKLIMHPTNSSIIIAATTNGMYRTSDAGANWTQVATGNFRDAEFKPGDPNTVYAVGNTFIRSTNNGTSWTTVSTGLPSSDIEKMSVAVTAANSAYVYVLIGRSSDQGLLGVYRSTDSGVSFTLRHGPTSPNLLGWQSDGSDSGGQAFYDLTIDASPTNAEIIFTGGVNIWKSTDGGSNWTYSSNGVYVDIHEISFVSANEFYVSCDGGIYKTTNQGTSFTNISSNLAIAQQYRLGLSATTEGKIITGHQDVGTNLLEGATWSRIDGGDGMDCFIDRTNNNNLFHAYYSGSYVKSTDNGVTWEDAGAGGGIPGGDWVSPWHQDPVASTTLYAAGRPQLYKTTNSGTTWSALGTPAGWGGITEFVIAPSNNQIIYAVKYDAVSKSTNGGTTWTNVSGTLPVGTVALTNVTVSNTDPNRVWVIFSGYNASTKVYQSTDGGTTWTNISTGLPNVPCNTIVYENGSAGNSIYVGTDIGVFFKDDSQSSWSSFFSGLPRVAVRDLEIFYPGSKIRAATYGRGTWESDLHTSANTPPVAAFTSSSQTICSGQTVTFTDNSTGSPTQWAWTFNGGTPSTANTQGPHVVTFPTAGTFTVTLDVTNAGGTDSESQSITVNASAVTPTITASGSTALCAGESVTLTSSEASGNVWSNGANTQSITVTTAGTYSVTVGSGPCSATSTPVTVTTISSPVTPVITASGSTALCAGESVTLTSSEVSGNVWSNGAITQSITVTAAGTYSVTVGSGSCSATSTPVTVTTISSPVTPIITASGSTALCAGESVTLTSSEVSGNVWSNGAITQSITVTTAGMYSVTVGSGSCTATSTPVTVTTISSPVTPVITASGSTTLCAGESVTLTSSEASGNVWSNGAITQSITVTAAGTYSVTVGSGSCSANSTPVTVTTISSPVTPVITTSGSTVLCSGESVTLTSSEASGNVWSNGAITQSITVTAPGTYSVTVGSGSCTATSLPMTISVGSTPSVPTITANGPTSFCEGGSVVLSSSASNGNTWSNGTTAQNVIVNQSGNYTVTFTNAQGCSATSTSIEVVVYDQPNVVLLVPDTICLSVGPLTLLGGSPSGGVYSGNGMTGDIFDPADAGLGASTITYYVEGSNGCDGSDQGIIFVDECLEISEVDGIEYIVYPNPNSGEFDLLFSGEISLDRIECVDVQGRMAKVWNFTERCVSKHLDLNEMPSGIYYLKINTGNTVIRTKVEILR